MKRVQIRIGRPNRLCRQFARILGATPIVINGVCTAQFGRVIDARILGRRTTSPLALPAAFSFESMDSQGRTLNLGETVLLQREANPLMRELKKRGITVTALHNHWLFENPRLMYMHFESIDRPLDFARKVSEAFRVLN